MELSKIDQDLEKLLSRTIVKENLIKASMYLSAFELLKDAIEKRVKNFLCISEPLDENFEHLLSQEYKDEILNKRIPQLNNNKNTYYASCLWLKENGAITNQDVETLQKIRHHRNKIGHELPKLLSDSDHEINIELFEAIEAFLLKIEQWWILNLEMLANPDFDDVDYSTIDLSGIKSGRTILLSHLIEVVKD